MRFSSVQKTWLARAARNGRSSTSVDAGDCVDQQRRPLRGRRPVRADRRLRTDEKHIRAQSAISDKHPALFLLLSITVFSVRMCFSSAQKTRLARGARNGRSPTSADAARYLNQRRPHLRGRRPVRADLRLGTDEKHIRAQSAILDKTPALSLFLSITMILVRMRFLSVPKSWLAREARNGRPGTQRPESRLTLLDDSEPAPLTQFRQPSSRRCAGWVAPRPPARSGLPCRRCRRRCRGACRCRSC